MAIEQRNSVRLLRAFVDEVDAKGMAEGRGGGAWREVDCDGGAVLGEVRVEVGLLRTPVVVF